MKHIVSIIMMACFCWAVLAQESGNYIVIINGDSLQFNLDVEQEYKPRKGEKFNIKIIQPNTLTYSDEMISFNYDKSLSVSNTDLGDGIEQLVVLKSTGNGFMIQKYSTFDPSSLTTLMINEITKESVSYGYEKVEKEFSRKLSSGQTLEGIEATLTYNDEKEIYTVATYGAKDQGIIVVTLLMSEEYEDKAIIDLFLNSLQITELR